jgi:hypothetical protein
MPRRRPPAKQYELDPAAKQEVVAMAEEIRKKNREKRPSPAIEYSDPAFFCQLLTLIAEGRNTSTICRLTGASASTINRVKRDYWDYICGWRETAIKTFEERFVGLEETLEAASRQFQEKLEKGEAEIDADAIVKLTRAQEITMRCIQVMKGEPTTITTETKRTTAEDVAKAREEALAQIREAEVVERGKEPLQAKE